MHVIRIYFLFLILLTASIPAVAEVDITFLGNQGYLLSDGEDKVLVDGFLGESYAIFEGLNTESAKAMGMAAGIFSGIEISLASHRHFEHFQPDTACSFLKASKTTLMVSSSQVITVLRERCKPFAKTHPNVQVAKLRPGAATVFKKAGVKVEIIPLSHGIGKYATLQHYGHLMTVGGKTILHIGDAAAAPADFIAAGLQNRQLDVVIVPYTYFLRPSGKLILSQYLHAETKIVGHIPPKEKAEITAAIAADFPDAIFFDQRMSTKTF